MLLSLQPRPSLQNTRSSSYHSKSAAQGCIKLPQLPLSHMTHPPSARQSITSHLQALHAQTFLAARIQKSAQTDRQTDTQTHRLLLNHKHTKDVLISRVSCKTGKEILQFVEFVYFKY